MTRGTGARRKDTVSSAVRHAPLEIGMQNWKKAKSYQAKHKTEAALRILRGENIEALSLEYGVTIGRLLFWKEVFLAGGENGMHDCAETDDSEIERLKREIEWQRSKNEELRQELRRWGCTPLV